MDLDSAEGREDNINNLTMFSPSNTDDVIREWKLKDSVLQKSSVSEDRRDRLA